MPIWTARGGGYPEGVDGAPFPHGVCRSFMGTSRRRRRLDRRGSTTSWGPAASGPLVAFPNFVHGEPLASLVIVDADGPPASVKDAGRDLRQRIADAVSPGTIYDMPSLRRALGEAKNGRINDQLRAALPHDEHGAMTILRADGQMVRLWWNMEDGPSKAMLHTQRVDDDE